MTAKLQPEADTEEAGTDVIVYNKVSLSYVLIIFQFKIKL